MMPLEARYAKRVLMRVDERRAKASSARAASEKRGIAARSGEKRCVIDGERMPRAQAVRGTNGAH